MSIYRSHLSSLDFFGSSMAIDHLSVSELSAEVPAFREGESSSDAESDGDVPSSGEEETGDEDEDEGDEEQSEGEEDVSESEEDEDEEQEALDADLAAPDGTESEDLEEDDAKPDPESSSDEEDEQFKQEQKQLGFLDGGKSDTFSRAFARIMDTSGVKAEVLAAPILAGSKSIAARKAEDEAEAKADRDAKRLRLEMKQRGHAIPKRRGEDPALDAKEKTLQKTATRGVVRLFNAVAKAQRRLREDEGVTGSRAKAAKLGKASFLAELRNSRAAGEGNEAVVPSARAPSAAAMAAQAQPGGSDSDEEGGAGWAVLQEGFTGLQGGSKMKDWDKQVSEDESEGGGDDDGDDSSADDS